LSPLMSGLNISLQLMSSFLSSYEIKTLKSLHRFSKRKQADKIKAILLLIQGDAYNVTIQQRVLFRPLQSFVCKASIDLGLIISFSDKDDTRGNNDTFKF
jgi:hypothetical protein